MGRRETRHPIYGVLQGAMFHRLPDNQDITRGCVKHAVPDNQDITVIR